MVRRCGGAQSSYAFVCHVEIYRSVRVIIWGGARGTRGLAPAPCRAYRARAPPRRLGGRCACVVAKNTNSHID